MDWSAVVTAALLPAWWVTGTGVAAATAQALVGEEEEAGVRRKAAVAAGVAAGAAAGLLPGAAIGWMFSPEVAGAVDAVAYSAGCALLGVGVWMFVALAVGWGPVR